MQMYGLKRCGYFSLFSLFLLSHQRFDRPPAKLYTSILRLVHPHLLVSVCNQRMFPVTPTLLARFAVWVWTWTQRMLLHVLPPAKAP